jgi:SAM-dependent methyltransferase
VRNNVKDFLAVLFKLTDCPEPIVEIGSFQVQGQEGYADMRPLFKGKVFIGCDMRRGPGVDQVEDVHALSFRDSEVGTVLLVDALEHIEDPLRAVHEIHRVLRPEGLLVLSSVMYFPIHDVPMDYWRFTPAAFLLLLRLFAKRSVFYQGNPLFPHTLFGVGWKRGPELDEEALLKALSYRTSRYPHDVDAEAVKRQYPDSLFIQAYRLLDKDFRL